MARFVHLVHACRNQVAEEVAFLKKSSAKDFCNLYTGCGHVPRPKGAKAFWFLRPDDVAKRNLNRVAQNGSKKKFFLP
jgi:hypothetical protein